MLALGLIETKGLIGAIEAADAMLKAANVRLLEKSLATGGLVTITITGEVAAVQAAVDAAVTSLARISGVECVSRHVIPRPDAELGHMLLLEPRGDTPDKGGSSPAPKTFAAEQGGGAEHVATPAAPHGGHDREKFNAMNINKLRQLAKSLKVELSREQIASADKNTLIDAIDRAARKEKE